jgi:hypothetical protein
VIAHDGEVVIDGREGPFARRGVEPARVLQPRAEPRSA